MNLFRGRALFALGTSLSIATSVLVSLGSPIAAQAARPAGDPNGVLDGYGEEFVPAVKPAAIDPSRRTTVILQLAGDPVAVVQGRAPGKQLSDDQKGQLEGSLKSQQDSLRGAIEAAGGEVISQVQYAYNGVKVEAPVRSLNALASLPNVIGVRRVAVHTIENSVSVPYIGAPETWSSTGQLHGEGVKVGIIDTGIDYTHANFGGPGTVAAFQAAKGHDKIPDPALFGPNAPKVKGGIDLVGDAYNGNTPGSKPNPGPNPLDCHGHGSHVGGTAAGFGENADGTTYRGVYDSTSSERSYRIGPGVAPKADLYAIRVFGCAGSTNVVVEALDWAVKNGMQVVNMSLGSTYGNAKDADVEATNNAVNAGIVVVASAGNSGDAPYINGSPAIAERAISVAATDSTAKFPGVILGLSPGTPITAINANGAAVTTPKLDIFVLRNPEGGVSLGCGEAEYTAAEAAMKGKLLVTKRGVCARVDRAIFGSRHGAAAVAMINTSRAYPPFEGDIPGVTIPFLGVKSNDGAALAPPLSSTIRPTSTTLVSTQIDNPDYRKYAGFSSAGPRRGDAYFKPDITAPGVSVLSTFSGTGNKGERLSGTSMAAPHVAGVAALAIQAHPGWQVDDLRAAIVNTGRPEKVLGNRTTRGGTGLVQPLSAVTTNASALTTGDISGTSLSFGFQELTADFNATQQLQVSNHGSTDMTFAVSVEPDPSTTGANQPHTLSAGAPSIVVSPGNQESLDLTLTVPAATAGPALDTRGNDAFRTVRGMVVLTPTGGSNGGVALRMPYLMVPRPRSQVTTQVTSGFSPAAPSGTATVSNPGGTIPGTADVYAWGLSGNNAALGEIGLRAVGVQSDGVYGTVAVSTFSRWSTPNVDEFDILLDTKGSGTANYVVLGIDFGLFTSGSFDGQMASAVYNVKTGTARIRFLATAPTDGSTIELPFKLSDVGLSSTNPRFTYTAESTDLRGDLGLPGADAIKTPAAFNAFSSSISNGQFVTVAPNSSQAAAVSIDPAEWATTPALGLMIVSLDNLSGVPQAQLIPVPVP